MALASSPRRRSTDLCWLLLVVRCPGVVPCDTAANNRSDIQLSLWCPSIGRYGHVCTVDNSPSLCPWRPLEQQDEWPPDGGGMLPPPHERSSLDGLRWERFLARGSIFT